MTLTREEQVASKQRFTQPRTEDAPIREDSPCLTDGERACIERLDKLAYLLDRSIKLPFDARIGLDGLIGMIPIVGDLSTFAVSTWIVNEARRLDVPRFTLWRMFWNVGVDSLLGAIPVVGDVFDFFNKANVRNVALLRGSIEARSAARATRDSRKVSTSRV